MLLIVYHLGTGQLWLETLGKHIGRLLLTRHHSSHRPFIVHHTTQLRRFPVDTKQPNTFIISLGLDLEFFIQFFPQITGSTSASSYMGFEFLCKDASRVPSCKKCTCNLFSLWRDSKICIINGKLITFISAMLRSNGLKVRHAWEIWWCR